MKPLETPVALIVFNRPDTTRRVFAAIAAVRPTCLLLIADGPRGDRPGEVELCEEVRRIVTAVDWQCEVKTNFAAKNAPRALRNRGDFFRPTLTNKTRGAVSTIHRFGFRRNQNA